MTTVQFCPFYKNVFSVTVAQFTLDKWKKIDGAIIGRI